MKLGSVNTCPECGNKNDSGLGIEHEALIPREGDASICIVCGHVMIFKADGALREPSEDELIEIMRSKTVREMMAALAVIRRDRPS